MKKYIFILISAAALSLTSCSDFLDKPQLDNVEDNSGYWRNEGDFRTYSVEFYEWFFPGYNSSYTTNYTPLRGYTFNDDVISGSGQQENFTSTIPSSLAVASSPSALLGQSWLAQYNGEKWNFGWVRKANIMIQRLDQYKGNLSDAAYKHWMSVARFFRAYAYYNLVISFGDVPYFDAPVDESDLATMYKDRTPRGEVMDHVYDDLQYAMQNAYVQDNNSTQYVNKYLIAGIASRIMLFEGTWEKYHNLDAARAKKYLQLCVDASDIVMSSGKYTCTKKDFRSLFGSDDLAGHPEVIFYRHYATSVVTHSIASYSNGQETNSGAAPTLALIKSFCCNDGMPYQKSNVTNAADFNLSEMAKTRDPRFEASFFNFPLNTSTSMIYGDKFISRQGASYYNDNGNRPLQYTGALNYNDAPILRYAEVLLNWIEAKEELAESYGGTAVTQADIDASINQIRLRPLDATAIANGVQQTKPLLLNNLPDDSARDSDVSKLLWEIRRERRMEFVFEHTRLLDIKRWKKINYMDNTKNPDTMFGSWVNFPKDDPSDLKPANVGKIRVRTADGTLVTYDGKNGDKMIGFFQYSTMVARDAFDEEKAYLSPVGTSEIQDYADHGYTLTQTAAWK